jgi:dynein light intermediate chain
VRVRDEIKMTIQAYQTLYESSIAYGMRKALMAEQNKNDMNSMIKTLEDQNDEHSNKIRQLEQEISDKIRMDEEEQQRA